MAKRTAPKLLDASGRRMWREISTEYDLRLDEYRILEDACREADLIEKMTEAERGAGVMTVGSMGQPVPNPLLAELARHRNLLAQLLVKLNLPDDLAVEGAGAEGNSGGDARAVKARAAAQTRWSRPHGA